MKNLSFVLFALFLITCSCSSGEKESEIARLKKANAALKEKLATYNDAIVITHENINKYVGALAFSQDTVRKNELAEVSTTLYLHNLPVEVEWSSDQENESEKKSGKIMRYIGNVFPGAGKRTLTGKYTVKFPNGEEWSIPWEKELIVK